MSARHIVGLSGGKDSTAMALRLRELNPLVKYEFIGNWTGNEPSPLFAHLKKIESMLGTQITRVGYHTDLHGLIED